MPHVLVRKSYYDEGWSSVDNPYGPGGYAYDGPPIEEPPPKPRRLRQSILPEFDPTLDETTGYTGVPPVSAFRVQDDNPAGVPVPQGYANVTFETGSDWNPDSRIQHPPVDDPIYDDDVESEYSRDPVSNVRYRQGRMGQRQFVDLPDAKAGTWVTRPTMGDVKNLYTHNYPEKIVMVRGPIDQYGRVHRRDSDKAVENLAEAFIEHDDPIPPERLVTIPLSGRTYLQAADDLGLPQTYNTRGGKTSRWSDALPPFRKPNQKTPRTLDDMTEEELLRDIRDEYKQTGEPMEIAFQLLKAGNVGSVRGMGSGATDNIYHYPHELDYDSMTSYMSDNPNATLGDMVSPYLQGQFTNNPSTNPPAYQSQAQTQFQNTVPAPFPQTPEQTQGVQQLIDEGFDDYQSRDSTRKPHYDSMNNAVRVLSRNLRANPAFNFAPPGRLRGVRGRNKSTGRTREMQNMKLRSMLDTPVSLATATMTPEQGIPIAAGEPMNIAFQLLKERKSPEAMRRKKEYDTKYESSPERVKYREELNRERKRRGIYGSHDHMDVSHTQGGRLTLEGEHANRARHFKNRGTLRRVRVR